MSLEMNDMQKYILGQVNILPSAMLKWQEVSAQVGSGQPEDNEICVYGPMLNSIEQAMIFGDNTDLSVSNRSFRMMLDRIQGDVVIVRFNTPGGNVWEANGIYTALVERANTGTRIVGIVDGLCGSAGMIPLMVCDEIYAAPLMSLMIHEANIGISGNKRDMARAEDFLAGADQMQVQLYSARMDLSTEQIEALLEAETWYNLPEALEAGLVDKELERGAQLPTQRVQGRTPTRAQAVAIDLAATNDLFQSFQPAALAASFPQEDDTMNIQDIQKAVADTVKAEMEPLITRVDNLENPEKRTRTVLESDYLAMEARAQASDKAVLAQHESVALATFAKHKVRGAITPARAEAAKDLLIEAHGTDVEGFNKALAEQDETFKLIPSNPAYALEGEIAEQNMQATGTDGVVTHAAPPATAAAPNVNVTNVSPLYGSDNNPAITQNVQAFIDGKMKAGMSELEATAAAMDHFPVAQFDAWSNYDPHNGEG